MGVFEWLLARFLGIGLLGVLYISVRETWLECREKGWRIGLATSWGKGNLFEALSTVFTFVIMLVLGLMFLTC